MPNLEDSRNVTFQIIDRKIQSEEQKRELKAIWYSLEKSVFNFNFGPYPVSHSYNHISKVITNVDKILDATIKERLCDTKDFDNNLYILLAAALIHDICMRHAVVKSYNTIDVNRNEHADFEKLMQEFISIHKTNYNFDIDLICLLASSHANSIDTKGKKTTTNEKIEELNKKYSEQYPLIEYFSRILQFADILDIGKHRLNPFNPEDFSPEQTKHYYKHRHFELVITGKEFKLIQKEENDYTNSIARELCNDLKKQFELIQNYLYFGWKLTLPIIPDIIFEEKIYVPSERRIRIQTSNICNLKCHDCHFDEYSDSREITPNYQNVITIIKNLKKEKLNNTIYPRPNISFTLTGGEPFSNEDYINELINVTNSNNGNKNSTFLLTNATFLEKENIEILKNKNINKLRISLNYNNEGIIERDVDRFNKIKALADSFNEIEIRINHVIKTGKVNEIVDFLDLLDSQFIDYIPSKISEVGFIQNTKDNSYRIETLAQEYCKAHKLKLIVDSLGERKNYTELKSGLKISFIKLNCDDDSDIIKRCFKCVQEQDIKISSDGSIRTCSGWDDNFKPKNQDVQINIESPLTGISGVIKSKYGIAGFYGHFPFIIKRLKGESIQYDLNRILYKDVDLLAILNNIGISISNFSIQNAVTKIAELAIQEVSPIKRLYLEGSYGEKELKNSTEILINLLRATYSTSKDFSNLEDNKYLLNQLLLTTAFLTVDEDLFSTGRTIIVRGIAKKILTRLVNRGYARKNDFIIDSTYCVATIALENIAPKIILDYLTVMLSESDLNGNCHVQYIVGCIYRQIGNEQKKALKAFENSYDLSEKKIEQQNNEFIKLYKEIRAESKRSLGALLKKDPNFKKETETHFLTSQFISAKDNTELRYSSLFSDGYSYLLKYFETEFEKNTPEPKFGYQAFILLSDSISLNPDFYASQIRIALLDLSFGNIDKAIEHLSKAQKIFCNKGILTDQEYLNKILCDYLKLYAKYEQNKGILDIREYSIFNGLNISSCVNVGPRDLECILEDMNILRIIISERSVGSHDKRKEFIHHIDNFNASGKALLLRLSPNYFAKIKKDQLVINEFQLVINEFHHVCIQTNDYNSSFNFYTKILDCVVIKENGAFHGRENNTWLQVGNIKIELQTPKNDKNFIDWSSENSGPVHICLVVDNVEKAYKAIKDKGCKDFKMKDKEELYTVGGKDFKIFKIKAPEGTEIEIRDNPNID